MTGWLLDLLGDRPRDPMGALLLLGLVVSLLPLALLVDGVRWWLRRRLAQRVLAMAQVPCPRGHLVALRGTWICAECHLSYEGHAFASCPVCGSIARAAQCPCGLPVENALWRPEP